jgi:hypothetical protein
MSEEKMSIEELSKKIETIDQATRILIRVLIDRMELLETEICKMKLKQDAEEGEKAQEDGE